MNALQTVTAPPTVVDLGRPLENNRHELFAQRMAAGSSLAAAYRAAGYEAVGRGARVNACRLAAEPIVQDRIRELCRLAAASATFDVRERMHALLDVASADPGEVCRVVIEPCSYCWPDDVYGAAVDRYMASLSGPSPLPAPDTNEPRSDCLIGPHARVIITPTHELSRQGRRLFKSVRQKANGEIEVILHDQLAASAQLAELAGWKIDRSLNLNANMPVTLPPATPSSVLDAFRALQAAKGST